MYGLPQAGILANKLLTTRLRELGYEPSTTTPGFWKHRWRPVWFSLVVDDFGVKYVGRQHIEHLLNALRKWYTITYDESEATFCGIKLTWNYEKGYIDLAMPGYIEKTLLKFQHKPPMAPQHAPHNTLP